MLGDSKSPTVNVLGDKLLSVEAVVQALENFKLTAPLSESFEELISYLNKVEAKGQTALGPAVVAGI